MFFDSNSTSKQIQVSATDSGKVVYGKGRITESGSFQIGDKGSYNESGAITVGNKGTLKTGTDLAGAKITGNVVLGDPGAAQTFAGTVSGLVTQFGNILSGFGSVAAPAPVADPLASGLESSAVPAAPGPVNKKLLIGGGLLLALVLWWWFRKR